MTIKRKYWLLAAVLLILAFVLSGCSSAANMLTGSSWPGIAASETTIYVAFGPHVYAVDPDTGREIWRFPDEASRNQTFYAAPAVSEAVIVVGDYNDSLYGLDPESGNLIWTFKNDSGARYIGGATIDGDRVYAGSVDGTVIALDLATGDPVPGADPFTAGRDIWSTPVVDGDVVYVSSLDKHIFALDADTLELLWQYPPNGDPGDPEMGAIVATPTLYHGILYFGSFNNRLYALDTQTRSVLWTYPTDNWIWSSPLLDDETGFLVCGDLDGNVFALNPDTGAEEWRFKVDGPVVGAPVLDYLEDGTRIAYIAAGTSEGNNLYVLNLETGTLADTPVTVEAEFTTRFLFFTTGQDTRPIQIYAAPLIIGDLLLLGAHQGNSPLYALDKNTLLDQWAFEPAGS